MCTEGTVFTVFRWFCNFSCSLETSLNSSSRGVKLVGENLWQDVGKLTENAWTYTEFFYDFASFPVFLQFSWFIVSFLASGKPLPGEVHIFTIFHRNQHTKHGWNRSSNPSISCNDMNNLMVFLSYAIAAGSRQCYNPCIIPVSIVGPSPP